jgi:hypothetical protein
MARYCTCLDSDALETGRHVIFAEASRIKSAFKVCHCAIVAIKTPIPHSLERRYLVEPCPLSGPQGEVRIGSNRHGDDVCPQGVIVRRLEP